MRRTLSVVGGALLALSTLGVALVSAAGNTVVVTPSNTQGWSTVETRIGGNVTYVTDTSPGAPYPSGALQLTTDSTNAAKAQYMHSANLPLSSVTELSYWTKQQSGPAVADPSYQVTVCLGGVVAGNCVGYLNLVFEPYWNGTVLPGAWQHWDVDAGQFWSSGAYSSGACSVMNGAGGPPFYTLAALQTACPNAVVVGFGVNVGTYNPNYVVLTDGVNFNGTTYDFQIFQVAQSADACKDGGWQTLKRADGSSFKNQGDCVSYVNTGR